MSLAVRGYTGQIYGLGIGDDVTDAGGNGGKRSACRHDGNGKYRYDHRGYKQQTNQFTRLKHSYFLLKIFAKDIVFANSKQLHYISSAVGLPTTIL